MYSTLQLYFFKLLIISILRAFFYLFLHKTCGTLIYIYIPISIEIGIYINVPSYFFNFVIYICPMEKLKTKNGLFIKVISDISEMTANRYYLLKRVIAINQFAGDIEECVSRCKFFLKNGKQAHAFRQILLLENALDFCKMDLDTSFAVLACLEATKEPQSIEEVVKKEKFLRSLNIDANELSELTEGLKKKLTARLNP